MSQPARQSNDPLTAASIPSNYSRLIARELGLQARELPGLLAHSGLTTAEFLNEGQRLTAAQQAQILGNALVLAGDPAFGLRLGARLNPSTHGAVGLLAHSSPNLRIALDTICRYAHTQMSLVRLELMQTPDALTCACTFQLALSADQMRCASDTMATIFFAFAEFIVGRPVHEAAVEFAHPQPSYRDQYAERLPGRLRFDVDQFRLIVPTSVADVPNASANRQSFQLAQRQCETMLAQLVGDPNSWTMRVQKLMLSQPLGTLTETEAAKALFMTKRTLARRLNAEGTGYREIREDILSQQASGYLADSELPVDAIASMLGYHDAANFRRAFKRWFGLPPSAYRQQSGLTTSNNALS